MRRSAGCARRPGLRGRGGTAGLGVPVRSSVPSSSVKNQARWVVQF